MSGKNEKTERYKNPVTAIFTGILDLFKRPDNQLSLDDLPSLDGKKVMITGASSGLGLATAIELARRGAHVLMAMRSGIPARGEEVRRKSGSDKVDMIRMDLSDLESLAAFAEEVKQSFGPLDIVVCNAAMVAKQSRAVKQELDEMFVVNYFAKFLLAKQIGDGSFLNHKGPDLPGLSLWPPKVTGTRPYLNGINLDAMSLTASNNRWPCTGTTSCFC